MTTKVKASVLENTSVSAGSYGGPSAVLPVFTVDAQGRLTQAANTTPTGTWNITAAAVTNGVYTTGNQTIGGTKTFSSLISGSIDGNAATATSATTATTANALNTSNSYQGVNFTATERFLTGNGSAAGPSIAFSSDGSTDTGFYWGSEGYTNFTNNGVYSGQIQPGGHLSMVGNVTANSDRKLKTNVSTIENALDKVLLLRGVNYEKIADGSKGIGVIAQEVQEVIPEVVIEGNDGILSVAYGNIVGVLIESIKEQQKQIEELKSKLGN